jgi:Protein of unknown function (DUF1573)
MFASLILTLAISADPLHAPEPVIDAGEVRVGPMLVRRFTFTNTAAEPLTITEVRSSCGCMTPRLTKREYQPGEQGELAVEVNTLSQPVGPHRWAFHLAYRCGTITGEQTLELTANLKQEIEMTPAAIAFRGSDPPPTTVTITDHRPKAFQIIRANASSNRLRAEVVADGVRVSVAPDCPTGQAAETVTIATDDPDYREIKLPVTIIREPKQRVTALPNRATLVAGGSALLQLREINGDAIQVDAIDTSMPALTCRWAAGPGDRTTVRISLDRTKWDGKSFNAEIRVRLKSPAGESVVIPVAVRSEE